MDEWELQDEKTDDKDTEEAAAKRRAVVPKTESVLPQLLLRVTLLLAKLGLKNALDVRELQAAAKALGIRANQRSATLMKLIHAAANAVPAATLPDANLRWPLLLIPILV